MALLQACQTLSYLVEEPFEDAGSFDWQRAWDSDLFFQYYCRRWQKKGQGVDKKRRGWDGANTAAVMSSILLGMLAAAQDMKLFVNPPHC